ncbi:LysR family transcriptional regulator [Bordetella genomosp. 9]|uniref:LysR family transcriptional regulator n=1 Tax=Bordetella genomosp. 9 TaxID=1416803 RepID=A0A261R6K5_9BORD|nr:LysR family transcriptional regulator [Bordetella genomosp. 9]OZI20669.1 LysR family transcriptional regulator [Bordetella genomosp. 9]
MHLDLRQLRQFVTIVELGGFGRAAQALHIAQPALSVSIRKLELAVGVTLLERLPRGVRPTAAGQALLVDARRSVFHADQARISARRIALGEMGTLRLGFVGSATYSVLPQRLPRFRSRYPDVRISLREETSLGLLRMLNTNELDAALVRGTLSQHPEFESNIVETDNLVLSVPASHPLSRRRRVRLIDLRDECFIMHSEEEVPGLYHLARRTCEQAGFTPRTGQQAIQVQTIISVVASGMGIALVPGAARAYPNPHVRFIDLADRHARDALHLSLVVARGFGNPTIKRLQDVMHPLAE